MVCDLWYFEDLEKKNSPGYTGSVKNFSILSYAFMRKKETHQFCYFSKEEGEKKNPSCLHICIFKMIKMIKMIKIIKVTQSNSKLLKVTQGDSKWLKVTQSGKKWL